MANNLINGTAKIVNDMCPVMERTMVLKYEKRWINSYILKKIRNKDFRYRAAIFSGDSIQWEEYN